jgi:hypothetical protein
MASLLRSDAEDSSTKRSFGLPLGTALSLPPIYGVVRGMPPGGASRD